MGRFKGTYLEFLSKILLFCAPIFGLFVLLNSLSAHDDSFYFEDNAIYFIGSSRVMYGIDPDVANEQCPEAIVYNVGMSSATFLHNMILADHLLDNFEAKMIFIELSPIIYSFHRTHQKRGLNPALVWKMDFGFMDEIMVLESYLFAKVGLKEVLREGLGLASVLPDMGHIAFTENLEASTESFLRLSDFDGYAEIDLREYEILIDHINKKAKSRNVRVKYFLPLTFAKDQERVIVMNIYAALSDSSRVVYPDQFVESMNDAKYLYDINHFNNAGSRIFTQFFAEYFF